jgi:hypothetical protein
MVSLRRLRELGIGHSVNWVMSEGFDYLLYPAVIWKLGPLLGGAIMSVASLLVCLGCLYFYDWSKRDWLGIEAIKDLESVQSFRRKQKARARVPSRVKAGAPSGGFAQRSSKACGIEVHLWA